MDKRRFGSLSAAPLRTAGALCLVMAASTRAWAGTEASFSVGLRITASCSVNSTAVAESERLSPAARPSVSCAFPTPRSVQVTRDQYPAASESSESVQTGPATVVTLTF